MAKQNEYIKEASDTIYLMSQEEAIRGMVKMQPGPAAGNTLGFVLTQNVGRHQLNIVHDLLRLLKNIEIHALHQVRLAVSTILTDHVIGGINVAAGQGLIFN